MKLNLLKMFFLLLLALVSVSPILSQAPTQTGDISGTVVDTEGNSLPGANISLSGPTLIGTRNLVSLEGGRFRFIALPPGSDYELRIELPGFKTTIEKGHIVNVGRTTTITVTLTQATVEEEVTVTAASPTIDVQTAKVAVNYGSEFLANIPMGRDLYNLQASVPGAVETQPEHRAASILGGTIRSQVYAIDGLNMNDPCVSYAMTNLNVDIYEEVEMELGSHQAEVGQTTSAYVNIVTKSGGNKFSGAASIHWMSKSLTSDLITAEDITAYGVNPPEKYANYDDESISLGGPIIKDKIWFFTAGRHVGWGRDNPYAPEARLQKIADVLPGLFTPQELQHYDITNKDILGFIKLTFQLSQSFKYMGLLNYQTTTTKPDDHLSGGARPTNSWGHTRDQGPQQVYATTHQFNWILNQNTFFDFRGSYIYDIRRYLVKQELLLSYPQYDRKNDIWWGRWRSRQEIYTGIKRIASIAFTRFEDNLLGASHQFKVGGEYEHGNRDGDRSTENPFTTYWEDRAAGNPYYVNAAQRIGQLTIYGLGKFGDSISSDNAKRWSAYAQDSVKTGKLAVNFGIRWDWSWEYQNPQHRNEITYPMGPYLMAPGISPNNFLNAMKDSWREYNRVNRPNEPVVGWEEFDMPYKKWVSFSTLSPRIGIVYDLFGNGKTALKASYGLYYEPVWIAKYNHMQIFLGSTASWYWYDLNSNKLMDLPPTDNYVPSSLPSFDYSMNRYAEDIKAPVMHEIITAIDHELVKDFRLGFQFILKLNRDCTEESDPINGYDPKKTDEKGLIWLPYTVTDPGWDGKFGTSDDKQVTVYGLRSDRPLNSIEFCWNPPEAYKNYWAAILTFDKRMSNRWQLSGSILYSSYKSTQPDEQESNSTLCDNPNSMINYYGPIGYDRPLQIKIMGTYLLPYDVVLSSSIQHHSGTPWQRTLERIYFPTGAPVQGSYVSTVNAEAKGSKRNQPFTNVDLRIEKSFNLTNFGRLRFYVDAFNILGNREITIVNNPNGRLNYYTSPAPTYTNQTTYKTITSVSGVRAYRLGIRFTF